MLIERYERKIQEFEDRIAELQRRLAEYEELKLQKSCKRGIQTIHKAYEQYVDDGGELNVDGGRTLYAHLFQNGYLEFIPPWYSQILKRENQLVCRE